MLRQLVLIRKIAEKNKALEDARVKDAGFLQRKTALATREAELEEALNEATSETTDEEKVALEAEVTQHEGDQQALAAEETEHETAKRKLTEEIAELTSELDALNIRAATPPAGISAKTTEERKDEHHMPETRTRKWLSEAVSPHLSRDDVKNFLARAREMKGQKRSVSGTDLLIPEVLLGILRDNMHRYSKLMSKVYLKPVAGTTRQRIAGSIPEGVWTEAVGALNELSLSFNQIEVDGYKVGGYIAIANSILDDSDINLASEIMDALGQAIGFAVDKAILFGTGTKMPIGIATRLAQTSEPGDWGANAPAWTDLHSTNLLKLNAASYATNELFFAALMLYASVAKANYSNGQKWWAMNSKTWNTLLSKTVTFNAAGALVAAQQQTMPIIGGEVVILEFISDYDIIGGYGSLYLLAERAGVQLAESEHVFFLQDQTVYKGTARYDGKPVFGEAFVAININNTNPTTVKTFAGDIANTVATPSALPIAGTFGTSTQVFLSCDTLGAVIHYTTDGSTPTAESAAYNGPITLSNTTTIKAIAVKAGLANSAVFSATFTKNP